MSERLYKLLLKLYPDHFRRTYGDEALRLVRDRSVNEKGCFSGLRLWLDLLADLAISLPREYNKVSTMPIAATEPATGGPSFQLLAERSLNPALLCLAGTLSAVSFWVCVSAVAHSRTFPVFFPAPFSLQGIVQTALAQVRDPHREESALQDSDPNRAAAAYSVCMTAQREIPGNSIQPLFEFHFGRAGASGTASIDGKVVTIFKNERRLSVRTHVFAGDHQFVLHLDGPAETTFTSSNDDFAYCRPK
jgi:hypothetical protein